VSFESVRAECSQNNTDVKSDHSQDSKDGFIRQTGIPVLQTAHFSTKTASTNKAQCTISMADLQWEQRWLLNKSLVLKNSFIHK